MNVLDFPIKSIIWGVFSDTMRTFLNTRKGEKDVFNTWSDCAHFIYDVYGPTAREKQELYPKPKKVYAYKDITVEDV